VREGILVNVDNVAATPHIGNRSDRGLSLRDLDRALARTHEEQRPLILLIGLEGASYEEAARIVDVPIGTVRSRVSRGREAIRKLMDRRDGMEGASGAAFMNAVPKPRPGR
jgi:RNA polymerase sigma-70 factor, ECF subfamily